MHHRTRPSTMDALVVPGMAGGAGGRRGVSPMRFLSMRSRGALPALSAVIALSLGATACSDQGGGTDSALEPTPTASAEPTDESPGPDEPSTSGTASPVPDPVIGTYVPILRNGKPPKPTVPAKAAPFDGVVRWQDGLRLDIVSVEQGKVEGHGPGVIVGEPSTALTLRMTNGSGRTVSLNGVVVTMLYGPDQRQARPVYDDADARDLTGVLRPGRSATAVYIFSVPRSELDQLRMYVDFDGVHTVALFRGSLT